MKQSHPKYDFSGKVTIITGAASGIGKATALAFANCGAKVVIADVQDEAGKKIERELRKQDKPSLYVHCNVSDELSVINLIQTTIKNFGRIDIAFNNAGVEGETGDTITCTTENWNKVINTNLTGIWNCMRFEIPEMLKTGGGTIVNCSSIAGLIGFAGSPAYVASKHGVIGLTKTAALEFAKKNIRINAVCPGVIHTPMIDRVTQGKKEIENNFAKMEPVGRMGNPEEIASAVQWLCSEGASFVTGHPLAVDGGWVAQ